MILGFFFQEEFMEMETCLGLVNGECPAVDEQPF